MCKTSVSGTSTSCAVPVSDMDAQGTCVQHMDVLDDHYLGRPRPPAVPVSDMDVRGTCVQHMDVLDDQFPLSCFRDGKGSVWRSEQAKPATGAR